MELDINLEFWMTNLPQHLKTIPIIYLAIPGSHDSVSYGITRTSKISPDADNIIQSLKFLGPIIRLFMANWSKTQAVSVTEQLMGGIRYFDLRIATKSKSNKLYIVHGQYSIEVEQVLEEINTFLNNHPKEVVIIDCQHFYNLTKQDHEHLMHLLTSTFGQKLIPYTPKMDHITLYYMENHYQAFVIYRADQARYGQPLLWPSASFPTPWPNTDVISNLIEFLTVRLHKRNNSCAFVSQCVLTPSSMFVVKHLFSSWKRMCFLPLEQEKYKWLSKQMPGRTGVNIIISDFVDYEDNKFSTAVINLNKKLLNWYPTLSSMTPVDDGS